MPNPSEYLDWTKAGSFFVIIAFTVFFFIYTIVFLRLILQLQEYFPHYFIKEKGRQTIPLSRNPSNLSRRSSARSTLRSP